MSQGLAHSVLSATPGGSPAGIPPTAPPPSGNPLSTADLVAKCEPSVALVKGKLGVGTGFMVGPRLLATNAHVIDDEFIEGIEVRFPSADASRKGPVGAMLLYEDAKRDLALLEVNSDLPALGVAGTYNFRKGEDVTVIGNPGLGDEAVLENAISRGVMSSRTKIDGEDFYQLGIAINPGNSGGPVLDQYGRVLGVASMKATKQEALAFCIPAADLETAMRTVATQPRSAVDLAASRHRLNNAFRLLSMGGGIFAVGLDVHRGVLTSGPQFVLHVGDKDLSIADFDKLIGEIDQKAFAPAKPQADLLRNDASVDVTLRSKVSELGDNYSAMKVLFAQPGVDLNAYKARVNELKSRHRQIIDQLMAP